MATVEDLKAQLITAAYLGAAAVCEPLTKMADGKEVQIDPLIQDLALQQKDVLVYEVAKVHYHAILRAFQDHTGIWPDPQLGSAAPVSPAAGAGIGKALADAALTEAPKILGAAMGK